jgi:hypothetical protein
LARFGEIGFATIGEARYHAPLDTLFTMQLPDLHLSLADLLRMGAGIGAPQRLTTLSPDLATPYSHQYNFVWETALSKHLSAQLGYVGSRSHKLLAMWFLNRAVPVAGVEQTLETVQQRRPDPTGGEERRILNGSQGYFDAGRGTLTLRPWHGFSGEAAYWFSKSLSQGEDHMSTAAGLDGMKYFSPSQFAIQSEMRGLTSFDQPHSFMLRGSYTVQKVARLQRQLNRAIAGWNIAAVALRKSGTPFTVQAGSDAPGYGNVDGENGDRPNVVDPTVLGRTIGNPDTARRLLPRSAFAYIRSTDTRGNLGWNTFRKGPVANINASLSRPIPVGGERQIELRVEAINLTNTPQFDAPGTKLTDPDFGYITNTLNDGRAFRFLVQLTSDIVPRTRFRRRSH